VINDEQPHPNRVQNVCWAMCLLSFTKAYPSMLTNLDLGRFANGSETREFSNLSLMIQLTEVNLALQL
jgi:hypothetical protein